MRPKLVQLLGSYLYMSVVLYITQTMNGDRLSVYFFGVVALIILELFTRRNRRQKLYHNLGLGLAILTYLGLFMDPFSWRSFLQDAGLFAVLIGLIIFVPQIYSTQGSDRDRERHESKYDR